MNLKFDPAADALHVRLSDAAELDSEEVRPGLVVDYDAEGRVVGFELLRVSSLPGADLHRMTFEVAAG